MTFCRTTAAIYGCSRGLSHGSKAKPDHRSLTIGGWALASQIGLIMVSGSSNVLACCGSKMLLLLFFLADFFFFPVKKMLLELTIIGILEDVLQ